MSYNGSGVYTLPGAQLVNGEVVSATENNTFRNDVATALNTAWTRDGQAPASANIPMNNHKFTGLSAGTNPGDSVRLEQATTNVDITGGSIDNAPIGAVTPSTGAFTQVTSDGVVESKSVGFKFPDGSTQTKAASSVNKSWSSFTSTGTYTVPEGVSRIRAYAFGAGGNGGGTPMTAYYSGAGGGGGGCAFGDIIVTQGQTVNVTISSGVATVAIGGTTYLTANKGNNASTITPGTGGTATKHASVTNGGAYTGGSGGAGLSGNSSTNYYAKGAGGGSAGSPLGNGYAGGNAALNNLSTSYPGAGGGGCGGVGADGTGAGGYSGGGGGAGGAAYLQYGGGAGSAASSAIGPGAGRSVSNFFSDPILAHCISPGGDVFDAANVIIAPGPGAGSAANLGGGLPTDLKGGDFGGGGGSPVYGGTGGFAGGGGGGDYGGAGGYGGGGGGSNSAITGGAGGGAIVLIYA